MTSEYGYVGKPSDEDLRAFLEGEHGPPSSEAVRIIQAELEHSLRNPPGERE